MTDKEILAELKKSYEYLTDIRENGCIDHCSGQLKDIKELEQAIFNIEKIYYNFYKTLNKEELKININNADETFKKENNDWKELELYICSSVDGDYDDLYDEKNKYTYWLTCEDLGYYWYKDSNFLNK